MWERIGSPAAAAFNHDTFGSFTLVRWSSLHIDLAASELYFVQSRELKLVPRAKSVLKGTVSVSLVDLCSRTKCNLISLSV